MNFSVIIPTMWKSDLILEMLPIYEKTKRIKEVIIIDNDTDKTPDFRPYKKVLYVPQSQNIFVNPAWNLGVALANYEIILANDDIRILDIEGLLTIYEKSGYDLIGLDLSHEGKGIEPMPRFPADCFGSLMYVKKYLYIPEQFKVWAGDNFLFHKAKKQAWVRGYVETPKSVSVNSENFRKLGRLDSLQHLKMNWNKTGLNIIIRTSNRPNYFRRCVESIRKFCPSAYLHVTVDDYKDLAYVHDICKDFSYNYYLIDIDIVRLFCAKIPIERSPFIYNYYINIAMPFIKDAWCMVLDDDDELVSKPYFDEKETDTIYLSRTEIEGRIIPSDRNFGKNIEYRDISTLCVIFHSSQFVEWTPQRGGDYQFIKDLHEKCTTVWLDKITAVPQTKGNFGKRNDIKDNF